MTSLRMSKHTNIDAQSNSAKGLGFRMTAPTTEENIGLENPITSDMFTPPTFEAIYVHEINVKYVNAKTLDDENNVSSIFMMHYLMK